MADTDIAAIDETLSTTGKPRTGGCLYANFNPDTCAFPEDAATDVTTLDGWVSLGDLSQDGLTYAKSATSNKLKGHQGTTVISEVSDIEETVAFTLIEPNRVAAARVYYGDNVTEGADGSVTSVSDMMTANTSVALCEDSLESNGQLRRTVCYKVSVDTFDDISHKQGEFIAYGVTGTLIKPSNKPAKKIMRAKPATV